MIDKSYIVHDDHVVKGFDGKYRFLSNFFLIPTYFEGILYPSSEHAYQAAKTLDFNIRSSTFLHCTSGQAKSRGDALTTRNEWHHIKYDVMSVIVFDKFYRNTDLRINLLATGNKLLEETNSWGDRFWGVCDEKGENNLGKILMGVRSFWGAKYPELLGKQMQVKNPLF